MVEPRQPLSPESVLGHLRKLARLTEGSIVDIGCQEHQVKLPLCSVRIRVFPETIYIITGYSTYEITIDTGGLTVLQIAAKALSLKDTEIARRK